MTTIVFHKDVFIPEGIRRPFKGRLMYSRHAIDACVSRGCNRTPLTLPEAVDVIEVEAVVTNGRVVVTKHLVRFAYDKGRDLVMPVLTSGLVTTLWFNHRMDLHSSLKTERYVSKKQLERMLNTTVCYA